MIVACVATYAVSLLFPLAFQAQGQRVLVVTSDSMAPRIRTGDAVVIQAVHDVSELEVGQVVSFWPSGGDRLVTHTIVDVRLLADMAPDPITGEPEPVLEPDGTPRLSPYIVTKGEANEENDPDATPVSRVRGVVLDVHRGWGAWIGWAHSPQGRWAMLAPPLVLLASLELVAARERRRRAAVRRAAREGSLDALLLD